MGSGKGPGDIADSQKPSVSRSLLEAPVSAPPAYPQVIHTLVLSPHRWSLPSAVGSRAGLEGAGHAPACSDPG